jgi:hypothetical protein
MIISDLNYLAPASETTPIQGGSVAGLKFMSSAAFSAKAKVIADMQHNYTLTSTMGLAVVAPRLTFAASYSIAAIQSK